MNTCLICLEKEKEAVLTWIFFGIFAIGALIGVLFVSLLSVAKDPEVDLDWGHEPGARPEPVRERV